MDLTIYFLYKLWLGVDSTLGAGAYILPFAMLSLQVVGHLLGVPIIIHTYVLEKGKSLLPLILVVDWLALILEYTIGGSAVPRGIYPNLVWLCILPFFLAHQEIPGLDIIVDPCAAIIVLFVTGLLCVGIKEAFFTVVLG
ncbi:hypothetical protein KPL71_014223 [Citrus sinensis]|uniref:Uncharacterized protein n=2 Tax=Citrus sinensis TaxID=2711 RepID=A0ACB8KA25_CITSI|nr:hypothetical protein KPL71_014223 [Citrus sinensis]